MSARTKIVDGRSDTQFCLLPLDICRRLPNVRSRRSRRVSAGFHDLLSCKPMAGTLSGDSVGVIILPLAIDASSLGVE